MVKTLINRVIDTFKTGKEKRGKLDLVTAMNDAENRYQGNLDKVYSQAQNDRINYETLLNRYSQGDILNPEEKKYGFGKKAKRTIAAVVAAVSLAACQPIADPRPDSTSTEQDSGDEGSTSGETTTPPVDPIPDTDYVDISGRLQDCESDSNQPGVIQVYDSRTRNPDGTYSYNNLLGETTANSEGKFSLTLENKEINPSDKIYIRARTTNPSYIRTLELNSVDNNPIRDTRANPAIRCVPYPSEDIDGNGILNEIDYQKYKDHVRTSNVLDGRGLVQYDIQNIAILETNPLTGDIMNGTEKNNLITAIAEWNSVLPSDKKITIVTPENGIDYNSTTLVPRKGLILLVKDSRINDEASGDTELYTYDNPFIVESALSRFDTTGSLDVTTVPLHELGHALYSPFHSDVGIPSIMASGGTSYLTTGRKYADNKEIKTVRDTTRLPEEDIEDILGL